MRTIAQERAGASRPGRWARIKGFFRDSWVELTKVIWPTQEEVVKMTGLVLAVVFVVAMFIFTWDQLLLVLTRPLLSR